MRPKRNAPGDAFDAATADDAAAAAALHGSWVLGLEAFFFFFANTVAPATSDQPRDERPVRTEHVHRFQRSAIGSLIYFAVTFRRPEFKAAGGAT